MSDDSSKTITWGPVAALAGTIGGFLLSQFLALTALLLFATLIGGWQLADFEVFMSKPSYVFLGNILGAGILLGLIYWFIRRRGSSLKAIGLGGLKSQYLTYGALGYVVYFAASVIMNRLVAVWAPHWLEQDQALGFDRASQGPILALIFISLVILPPLVEEILFRGFLYGGLRKAAPVLTATLITSGLFAVAHLQGGEAGALLWISAIDTFILSLVLCHVRERSGSLWPPIMVHALKNGVAFAILFIFRVA